MKTKPIATTATVCNPATLAFPAVKKRRVTASFSGGEVTSDGGLPLLRQIDRRLGLTRAVAAALPDPRDPALIEHAQLTLVRQRIFGLCHGYEDLNDHDHLRHDPAWQTAVEQVRPLASSPTLCRLENRADAAAAWALHQVMVEQFIASFAAPPAELILDFDATDDRVHGQQVGAHFHGYYRDYCFLPLYVFCGEQLLVAYLRPSHRAAAHHAGAILKLLVQRLRQAWPKVKIIFRGDSGFCRPQGLRWCERHQVHYLVGLAQNPRLLVAALPLITQAEQNFQSAQTKQRHFGEVQYAARNWPSARRVIVKAEHTALGRNPRFLVTNLTGDAQKLYDEVYCARGEMENRIKEQQLGLFADRTSCHGWWANQFRLLLSSLAYVLLERLRALGLAGTELARAQAGTIRLKLLKLGAVVLRNTRRIQLLLSRSHPYQRLFAQVATALGSG